MKKMPKLQTSFQSGDYSCEAYSRRAFPERKLPNGETESLMVRLRGIILTHKSGAVVRFPYTVRQGAGTFGDSRSKDLRYTVRTLRPEIARMVGEEAADRLIPIATY